MALTDAELDLLAWDVSDAFAKDGHPLDLSIDDIRPHLAEFIAKCQTTAARSADADADEPGPDAARSMPQSEPRPETPRFEPPKMGRVRVFTVYSWTVWGTGEAETPTASIIDWRKNGEFWARMQVEAAVRRRYPDATDPWIAGLRKERLRIRPYASQSVEVPADADEVSILP